MMNNQNIPQSKTVVRRPNDPFLYLLVGSEWFCYNPSEPPLGGGAMGDVYRGYRCNDGSVVAIKRVKDAYANNSMIRSRARQEASCAFRHQNLIEMIGCCEMYPTFGPIFLVSKYVNGTNLDKYVQSITDGPRKLELVCRAVMTVLDALDYIHSRGVVHRDIKPSNIMVEDNSSFRLMDLGIARMNGGNKFSHDGFIGTPQYSAPEQISRKEGVSVQINATTDIYGLGITFYELLTGKNPMEAKSDAETLANQMNQSLPSDPFIPSRIMNVIWLATEKEQSKRFQTAQEFQQALKQALLPESYPRVKKVLRMMKWILLPCVILSLLALLEASTRADGMNSGGYAIVLFALSLTAADACLFVFNRQWHGLIDRYIK